MSEPEQLKRGKRFQEIVQRDFKDNSKDGTVIAEKFVSFKDLKEIKQKSGRMDIFIEELDDFVTIVEIKATNWAKIKPKNIKKNLYRHQKQLFNYIEKYLEIEKMEVCLGIIYPEPPKTKELRDFIEKYLEDNYGVPAYWFNEIKSKPID